MKLRCRLASMLVVAAVLAIAPSTFAQTPRAYRVEELGSFGGPYLVGLAINSNGEIAGYGYLANGTIHAFRWTESGGLEDLGANGGWLFPAVGVKENCDGVCVCLDSPEQPPPLVAPPRRRLARLARSHRPNPPGYYAFKQQRPNSN